MKITKRIGDIAFIAIIVSIIIYGALKPQDKETKANIEHFDNSVHDFTKDCVNLSKKDSRAENKKHANDNVKRLYPIGDKIKIVSLPDHTLLSIVTVLDHKIEEDGILYVIVKDSNGEISEIDTMEVSHLYLSDTMGIEIPKPVSLNREETMAP